MVASAQSYTPRASRTPSPVPPERPYTLGDDNEDEAPVAHSAPRPQSREMTAQSRIERTMGTQRPSSIASIIDPGTAPRSGVLAAPAVSAFAPPGGSGAAFASGRGLY
jgi:hypothetical protein